MSERTEKNPMEEMTLEKALDLHFTAEPAPEFLAALEQKLLSEQANRTREAANRSAPAASPSPSLWQRFAGSFRPRPVAVAFVLLLVLLVPLLIIGPRRAWAGLQAWLGYVPGVGFVDLQNTRVLLAPAVQTRDGVTLRVTEVIAGPRETTVVVESAGLPPEDELWGQNGAEVDEAFVPILRLPDGAALPAETFTLRVGRGALVFPPLPQDVYRATLELPLLPLTPPGAAPEGWRVPLLLQPASGELVGAMYPQPYRPQGATDTHHGITLGVLEVAHTAQKTVFTVQTTWQDESWEYVHPERFYNRLYDDLGHVYGDYAVPNSGNVATLVQRVQPGDAPPLTSQQPYDFVPVSLAANTLTLEVPQVQAGVPATGAFTVDLGERPRVGDSWNLDVRLDVAGFPVHITRAWIGTEQLGRGSDAYERTNLYLYLEAVPEQASRNLAHISIFSDHAAFDGGGGSGQQLLHLTLADGQALPGGEVNVSIDRAWVNFHGPWRLQWQLPDENGPAPTFLHPASAETANGVTLQLDRVTLTDRVTALDVALLDGPEGSAIHEILHGIPGRRLPGPRLRLEDDRLHDYQFDGGNLLWWQPDGLQPPTAFPPPALSKQLHFPAVQPLARRLTLQIPAIALAIADEAAFTVEVPQGVAFSRTEHGELVSDPWSVDARFTIAGYDVSFTEARLTGYSPLERRIVLAGTARGDGRNGRGLYGLRVGSITAPDGRSLQGEQASGTAFSGPLPDIHSAALPDAAAQGRFRVTLGFPVVDPATAQVQAGRYRVALEGINELVEGPWTFRWSLQAANDPVLTSAPYRPPGAGDSDMGIALEIQRVAHTPEETTVQVGVRWPEASWQLATLSGDEVVTLVDDRGQRYHQGPDAGDGSRVQTVVRGPLRYDPNAPTAAPGVYTETLTFAPVSAGVEQLSLSVDAVQFSVPLQQSVTVDLGDNPQVGDRWDLDVSFEVAGLPVHISGARLVEEGGGFLGLERVVVLQLEIDPVAGADGRLLRGLALTTPAGWDGARGGFAPDHNQLEAGVFVSDEASLPTGPVTLQFFRAVVLVDGVWELSWNVGS